jgi:hypothetical protein
VGRMAILLRKLGLLLLTILIASTFSGINVGCCQSTSTTVVINEFMANNKSTIQNSLGNYTDWIELYNPTEASIVLDGMFLTDNVTNLKWQFTNTTTILPHQYLLVWADGNIRYGSLHTSFKLDKAGGVIALIAADGSTVLDSVTYSKQISDASFGRIADGGLDWNYLLKATPGEANGGFSSLFRGYPWEVWVVMCCLVVGVILVVFKDNLVSKRRRKVGS